MTWAKIESFNMLNYYEWIIIASDALLLKLWWMIIRCEIECHETEFILGRYVNYISNSCSMYYYYFRECSLTYFYFVLINSHIPFFIIHARVGKVVAPELNLNEFFMYVSWSNIVLFVWQLCEIYHDAIAQI